MWEEGRKGDRDNPHQNKKFKKSYLCFEENPSTNSSQFEHDSHVSIESNYNASTYEREF